MSSETVQLAPERILDTVSGKLSGRILAVWLAAILVGAAGFFLSVQEAPQRVWQAVWINFIYFVTIAQAGVMFGAVLVTARGHWGKPFRRVAEAMYGFLPIAVLVFFGMSFGAEHVFPWVGPVEGHINRDWLTVDGLFLRNGALLLILLAGSTVYLRLSIRPDAPLIAERLTGWRRRLMASLASGWRGDEEEAERSRRILNWLAPVLVVAWVFLFSFLGVDLTMSLIPGFVSVIWGWLFVVAGWLPALCLIALLAHFLKKQHDLGDVWTKWEFHDIGKLMFAFTIFWSYMWWSQYLPIWYGNIGRETIFFEQRLYGDFAPLFYAQMALVFAIPFTLLLARRPKMSSRHLSLVAVILLVGFWLERYNAVVPSTWKGEGVPFGLPEITITIGFVGMFGLGYSLVSSLLPKLPIREALIVGERGRGP
ncbi:MAG: hypothetical protein ABFS14_01100 [Gemmatimonadota bacterium]